MSRSPKRPQNPTQVARRLTAEVTDLVLAYVKRSVAIVRSPLPPSETRTLREATDDFHRAFVLRALEARRMGRRWNISATAQDLGVARSRLYALIENLDLPTAYEGP